MAAVDFASSGRRMLFPHQRDARQGLRPGSRYEMANDDAPSPIATMGPTTLAGLMLVETASLIAYEAAQSTTLS